MQIDVNGYFYDVIMWSPDIPVLTGEAIAIDTETHMIEPGVPIKPVIEQVCVHAKRIIHIVDYTYMDQYNLALFEANPCSRFIFHNAAFDLHVMGMEEDDFKAKPYLMNALVNGQVTDTGIRYLLLKLAKGSADVSWNLKAACKDLLQYDVDKNSSVRLSFQQNVILDAEHLAYAASDPAVTAQLAEKMPLPAATEQIHLLGYIALCDISRRGFLVDRLYLRSMKDRYLVRIKKLDRILAHWGYVKGRKGNDKIKQRVLALAESVTGITLPRTATGKLQTDKEVLQMFGDDIHPFLQALSEKDHCDKMIANYMNEAYIGADGRVHTRFSPLVKTGRTSSSRPNLQNIPRKENIRGIYMAPLGYVLYASDYKQLELCALAQANYTRFGESKLRELINEGLDVHRWLGDHIMNIFGGSPDDGVDYRQMAKAANFGLPGGLGAATFKTYAFGSYGVDLSMKQCEDLKALWLDMFPEMRKHLKPTADNKHADMYIAQTINGRVRRKASFCAACNYQFQGLSADGAKMALWFLYMDRYQVVNFVHDETLTYLREDSELQNHVKHIDFLMVSGMETVIKDVSIQVEGALMRTWAKEAKPVHDENGNLLIWDPNMERIKK